MKTKLRLGQILCCCMFFLVLDDVTAQQTSDLKSSRSRMTSENIRTISNAIQAEIIEMEKSANELWSHAKTINDEVHIGTMYNELDVSKHECYLLGRLIGYGDLVKGLRPSYKPNLALKTQDNAHELRVIARSMDNYASVARRVLSFKEDERVMSWNLDCPDRYDIPDIYVDQEGMKPFFMVVNDNKVLRVLGDIERDFSTKLDEALRRNPQVTVVALGSGGGSVLEAIKAGINIRRRGLETTLWNSCYSACPLVFIGGVSRTMWSPFYNIGFHQVSVDGKAIPMEHDVYRAIFIYAHGMGVDGEFVIKSMWSSSPESMTIFNVDDTLCESRVFTWIQRACSSN